tara:strand:+ start:273 stop:626 length:354 start_codon:yes stop_codon:yes gene_type:complete
MITKKDYEDLKEYWDYQRKIEYNKEIVRNMADQFEGRIYNDFGRFDINEMKDLLWTKVKTEDYEEPRKGWVPKDETLRFEWEGSPSMPKTQLNKPKDQNTMYTTMPSGWEDVFDDTK